MWQELMFGQYYPRDSWLHSLDPRSKLVGLALLMTAFFMADNFYVFAIMGLLIVSIINLSRIPWPVLLGSLRPLVWLLVITLLLPLCFTPGRPLVILGPVVITQEGLNQGVYGALRLAIVIVFTALLTFTTSPIALTDGLEALLKPFRRLGLPAHQLAMMLTIAMRFIPTLLEEAQKVISAQKARGAKLDQGNIFRRAKAYFPILLPLLLSAFRRADHLAFAMEARCYRGGQGRTRLRQLKWQARDTVAILICTSVLVGVIWLAIRG